ncbi:MAG: hypothetical protein ACLGJC_09710 [Alphaproteobacteria bacterium]
MERLLAEEDAPTASGAFAPAAATVDELRAFLTARGAKPHHLTGEAKLREMAAAELAKE